MLNLSRNIFLIPLFLFQILSPTQGSEWIPLSEKLNPKVVPVPETLTSRHALTPSMAFWKDQLYVAWTEPDSHGVQQIYIKRLVEGTVWEPFGKSQNRDRSFSSSTPFLASNGKSLFLSWSEKNNDNVSQVYVKQSTGSGWEFLGESLNISKEKDARNPVLAFLNETPYLAWNELGEKEWSKLYVKHWNGKTWIEDGPGFGLAEQHITQAPALLFEGKKGHLVWAESDETRVFQIHYAQLEEGKWSPPQPSLNQDPKMQAFNPSLALLKDELYLVFQEKVAQGNFKIQFRHLTPAGWSDETKKLAEREAKIFNPVIASDQQSLIIAWEEWDAMGRPKIAAQMLNPSGEIKMVSPLMNIPDHFGLNPLLFSNHQNTFLAWKETNESDLYQIQIRKFIP